MGRKKKLSRNEGHRQGAKNLDQLLDYFFEVSVPFLSLYVFSTENWKRPPQEIDALWSLLDTYFSEKEQLCSEKNIRVILSGEYQRLPSATVVHLENLLQRTKGNNGTTVNFCLNYGSRAEIVRACNLLIENRLQTACNDSLNKFPSQKKILEKPVTVEEFQNQLFTQKIPDVDLLIRTGGEQRLSNFLLWQCAYAEIFFTETLWPDLRQDELKKILNWYRDRQRKFGGLPTLTTNGNKT